MDLPASVPPVIRDAARVIGRQLDDYTRSPEVLHAEDGAWPGGDGPGDGPGGEEQGGDDRFGGSTLRDRLVLVACSGGPDSTALALAAAHAQRTGLIPGWRVGAVIVDHGLQPGSARVATTAAGQLAAFGLDPIDVVQVQVDESSGVGPEAAARKARYDAFEQAADGHGAQDRLPRPVPAQVPTQVRAQVPVLLGHTLDDQAETVLLGLARGSGARSLAGMAAARGRYLRPLLTFRRRDLRQALDECGVPYVDDPHNEQERFLRARVRHHLMPALIDVLGDQAVLSLARTADLLRADADALDDLAQELLAAAKRPPEVQGLTEPVRDAESGTQVAAYDAQILASAPIAVVGRAVLRACTGAGVPAGSLTAEHVRAVRALITDWRGQGAVRLPAFFLATRRSGTLILERSAHHREPTPER